MKKKRKASGRGKRKHRTAPAYPPEFRLKVVRLYLEEGYKTSLLAQEFGVSEYSIYRWAKFVLHS